MNWDSFVQQRIYIDCLVFLILGAIHIVSNARLNEAYPNTEKARSVAATSIGGSMNGGLTAVGILLPLSLVATQIPKVDSLGALQHVVYADIWFGLSLLFGVYGAYRVGIRSVGENVVNLLDVRIVFGLQLIALVIGTARLVVSIWGLAFPRADSYRASMFRSLKTSTSW